MIIGEPGFIQLLEQAKVGFIRTRGIPGYLRGSGRDGALVQIHTAGNRPIAAECGIEEALEAAFAVAPISIKDRGKLRQLLLANSFPEEWEELIAVAGPEAVKDLKLSRAWRARFALDDPSRVALPGVQRMQCKVFSTQRDLHRKPVDALLSLLMYNRDLLLAQRYGCSNISPAFPVCDLIDLKAARLPLVEAEHKNLWELLELANVPDFSDLDLSEGRVFEKFLSLVSGQRAIDFRKWFQERSHLDSRDLQKEYVEELRRVPGISRLPAKSIRFILTTGASVLGPAVGLVAGLFDTFVVEKLFGTSSPKFFLDDLTRIRGDLTPSVRRSKGKTA